MGVGFSMGGNHLLKYLGQMGAESTGIKAAMTIGNPFDVLATGLQNKYTLYGFYDSVLVKALTLPYLE